jgi:hypothetical protein
MESHPMVLAFLVELEPNKYKLLPTKVLPLHWHAFSRCNHTPLWQHSGFSDICNYQKCMCWNIIFSISKSVRATDAVVMHSLRQGQARSGQVRYPWPLTPKGPGQPLGQLGLALPVDSVNMLGKCLWLWSYVNYSWKTMTIIAEHAAHFLWNIPEVDKVKGVEIVVVWRCLSDGHGKCWIPQNPAFAGKLSITTAKTLAHPNQ